MSDTSTERVYFEVGIAEDPRMVAAMERLAQTVLSVQQRMTAGVSAVAEAANAASGSVGQVDDAVVAATNAVRQQIDETRESINRLAAAGAAAQAQMAKVDRVTQPTVQPSQPTVQTPRPSSTDEEKLEKKAKKEKEKFEKAIEKQKKAFEKYAADLDRLTESQEASSERLAQGALKSARGMIDAAKGFALLGVVSEENSEKLLRSIVVIEGAFNVVRGSVETLAGFAAAWRAVRSSTEAATKAQKIQQIMMGPQFAQLRAYQATLVQEAIAANAAAAANDRLAHSRAGASGQAGGTNPLDLVPGGGPNPADSAGGGARKAAANAGAAAGGGKWYQFAAGNSFMGMNVGKAGTAGAAIAAAAAVGVVLWELGEMVSGTSTKMGSLTDTIGTMESHVVQWISEMTGWFEWIDNAGLKEAEKKSGLMQFENESKDSISRIDLEGERKKEEALSKSRDGLIRFQSSESGSLAAAATDAKIFTDAMVRFERLQNSIRNMQKEGKDHTAEYANAIERAQFQHERIEDSTKNMVRLVKEISREQIESSQKAADEAKRELENRKESLKALAESRMSAVERFANLDDFGKQRANEAIRQARMRGANSLSEEQRELLKTVGGKEANEFARQADINEARKFGFDKTFGLGFDQEQIKLMEEKNKIEATIKQTNQIIINVEDRNKALIEEIMKQYSSTMRAADQNVIKEINRQTDANRLQEVRRLEESLRAIRANRK